MPKPITEDGRTVHELSTDTRMEIAELERRITEALAKPSTNPIDWIALTGVIMRHVIAIRSHTDSIIEICEASRRR